MKLRAKKVLDKNYHAPIILKGRLNVPEWTTIDIPQTPEPNERETHISKLKELAQNFDEDEAEAVIYILSKKYPEMAFSSLLKAYKELNDKVSFVNSVIEH